jgi:hypothetical protein
MSPDIMLNEINRLEFVTEVDDFNRCNVKKPPDKNWIVISKSIKCVEVMYKEFVMKNQDQPVKRVHGEVIKYLSVDPLVRSFLSFKKVFTTLTIILALVKKIKSLFLPHSEIEVQSPEKLVMLEPF